MTNYNVLPLPKLNHIERISPSHYSELKSCKLKVILQANRYGSLMPTSPSARLGEIAHRLLQIAVTDGLDESTLQASWDTTCKEVEQEMAENPLEKHLVPLESSASNFEVKKSMLLTMLNKMNKKSIAPKEEVTTSEAESWYETKDGKVGGIMDLVMYTDSGAEIIDYKTGAILDTDPDNANLPKLEYQQQLKLYAALFHEVKNEWPHLLILKGLDQKQYEIRFTKEECLDLLASAKNDLDDINRRISENTKPEEFASPSPGACKYCIFRPSCSAYWKQRKDGKDWPNDVIGEIKENKKLEDGLHLIIIQNEQKVSVIRGLSIERYNFLNKDVKTALFCNLSIDPTEGFYVDNMLTVGYQIDK